MHHQAPFITILGNRHMTTIHTHIEHVAFDLGMQIIARHGLQIKLNEASAEIMELRARLNAMQSRPEEGSASVITEVAQQPFTCRSQA
jgi:hypothetical protein